MSDFLTGIGWTTGVLGLLTLMVLSAVNYTGQGATFRERILSSPTLSPLLILHYFLPYGLIVLVLFMDLMSQLPQGVFGIVIGFVLMMLNWIIGGSPDFPNDLCEIPGMKGIASKGVPQSLLFVSTVVFYLASFVTVSATNTFNAQTSTVSNVSSATKGGPVTVPELITSSGVTAVSPSPVVRIGASWGLAISVVLIQLFGILSTPGCLVDSLPISNIITFPPSSRAILAILIGGAVGGGLAVPLANSSITQPSYSVTGTQASQIVIPATSTTSTQARGPGFVREQFQLGAGLGEMPMPSQGSEAPIDIAKTSGAVTPGESSDQFVCEAYKNGQLVTSTLIG